MCQRDLKQLTKIEYGRIKTEKDKLGETRKYKAGGMREVGNVGELGKEKGGERGEEKMRSRPREQCDGEIQPNLE